MTICRLLFFQFNISKSCFKICLLDEVFFLHSFNLPRLKHVFNQSVKKDFSHCISKVPLLPSETIGFALRKCHFWRAKVPLSESVVFSAVLVVSH